MSWDEVLNGNPIWFNHMLGFINKKVTDANKNRK